MARIVLVINEVLSKYLPRARKNMARRFGHSRSLLSALDFSTSCRNASRKSCRGVNRKSCRFVNMCICVTQKSCRDTSRKSCLYMFKLAILQRPKYGTAQVQVEYIDNIILRMRISNMVHSRPDSLQSNWTLRRNCFLQKHALSDHCSANMRISEILYKILYTLKSIKRKT